MYYVKKKTLLIRQSLGGIIKNRMNNLYIYKFIKLIRCNSTFTYQNVCQLMRMG